MIWGVVVIIVLGIFVPALTRNRTRAIADTGRRPSGQYVLFGFACVVALYGGLVTWQYWEQIKALADQLYLAFGLGLVMIAGMFVRVLSGNHQAQRPLFAVSATELIYPMLFSPIVFFAIWVLDDGSSRGKLFLFHAAFLNGFFWESIVSAARRPEKS